MLQESDMERIVQDSGNVWPFSSLHGLLIHLDHNDHIEISLLWGFCSLITAALQIDKATFRGWSH